MHLPATFPLPSPVLPGKTWIGSGAGIGDVFADIVAAGTTGAGTAIASGSPLVGGIQAGVMAIAPFTGPAAPVVATIAGLIGPIAVLFKGCGQTCVQATQYANRAEDALKQILAYYRSQPIHYASVQKAALQAFDQTWAQLVQACSNPALGDPGRRCIAERQRGGTAPWCPSGTGCDWFILYRDPIANDPAVVPDPAPPGGTGALASLLSGTGGGLPVPLILAGGLALVLLLASGGGK